MDLAGITSCICNQAETMCENAIDIDIQTSIFHELSMHILHSLSLLCNSENGNFLHLILILKYEIVLAPPYMGMISNSMA